MHAPATTALATNPNAVKQRNFRARIKQGLKVYTIEVGEQMLSALIAAGRLTPTQTEDRDCVRQELTSILDDWAENWSLNDE